MPYKLEIKEEAMLDIVVGAAWYSDKQEGLDKKFLLTVENTFKSIQKNPYAYKKGYQDCREAGVRKFPYLIVYKIEDTSVVVFAVFNTWQNPRKKIKRIKN